MIELIKSAFGVVAWIVLLALGATGCKSETHEMAKEQAEQRWAHTRASVMMDMARGQFEVGDVAKAEESVGEVLASEPKNAEAHTLMGRILINRNELERALIFLNESIKLQPKSTSSYYLRGVVYQRWQKYERANTEYLEAYRLEPDDVSGLIGSATMLVKLGRESEAITKLNEKLAYFENNADIRVALAGVYLREGMYGNAVETFRQAMVLRPNDQVIQEQLAMAMYAAHHYADAIQHLQQLTSQFDAYKNRRDLKMALADCYVATDSAVRARSILIDLTDSKPTDIAAWIQLGQVGWILDDHPVLRRSSERVVSLASGRTEGYILKGVLAHKTGELSEALKMFDYASSIAPNDHLPHLMKGMVHEESGDLPAARAAYATAIKLNPKDSRAQTLMAKLDQRSR